LPHCAAESSHHFNAPELNDDYLRRAVLHPTELRARGSADFTVCAGRRPIYRCRDGISRKRCARLRNAGCSSDHSGGRYVRAR